MAELISSDVEILDKEKTAKIEDFLRNWQEIEKIRYKVKDKSGISEYNFEEFIAKFIESDVYKTYNLRKITQEKSALIEDLRRTKKEREKEIGWLTELSWRTILHRFSQDETNKIFNNPDFEITKDHFPLIRFLFISGNLNETYWYYMTNFIDKTDYPLKKNDIIFMKGFLEGAILNKFLEIESPDEILERLSSEDFLHSNILNYELIKRCIERKKTKYIIAISKSVQRNNNYYSFIKILEKLGIEKCKKYVDILIRHRQNDFLRDVLEEWNSRITVSHEILDELIEYIREKNISSLSQFLDKNNLRKKRSQYNSLNIPNFNYSKKIIKIK